MQNLTELAVAAKAFDLQLSEQQLSQLDGYLSLIQKWNKAYNLVGTSNKQELIVKHLLDSLVIAPYVKVSPVLDVGSGAGLPGIPLAIALPDISFTLLDANSKKTRFMRQTVIELELKNVQIEHTRIESYFPENKKNTVISRAFAPLEDALERLSKVCAQPGQILIMLGLEPKSLPDIAGINTMAIHSLSIPGLSSKRHLLVADKK